MTPNPGIRVACMAVCRERRPGGFPTRVLLTLLAAGLLVAACEVPTEGVVQGTYADDEALPQAGVRADGTGNDPAAYAAAHYLAQPRFTDADLTKGEVLSLACVVCHTLGAGERHLVGPNLHGVFGRAAGTAASFEYSAALREAAIVWTPDELDTWLAEPEGFVPGNNMVFAGYRSASDRTDLLAYLLHATGAAVASPTE